jgi:hypothetical protein
VVGTPGSAEADVIFKNTRGAQYETPIAPLEDDNVIKGNNIEWVVERVAGEADTGPTGLLLDFGTITFTSCSGSTANQAASSFPKDGTAINMLNGDGGLAADTVVNTAGDGDAFDVIWVTN